MRKLMLFLVSISSIIVYGQSPQNIIVDSGESESLWSSKEGIVIFVVFVILLVVGRTWSKKIHRKRDELSSKK
jgi:Flp pilus assembly protein TadB